MSKSYNNAIYLSDSAEEVEKKVKKATTDSDVENLIRFDKEKKPNVSNLMLYYQIATGLSLAEVEEKYKGLKSYKIFKDDLAQQLNNFLDPIRERRSKFESDIDLVWDILHQGNKRAREEGQKTMEIVKEKMKINY